MKKFFKQLAVVAGLTAVAVLAMSAVASAQTFLGGGASESVPTAVLQGTGGQGSLRALALTIINFFLGFLGLTAVAMIIYAGVLYVTAAGNDDNTGKAKKIIMYAILGLLIVLLSWAIVNTILGAGLGQEPA